jgi:hypothetical protein
MKSHHLSIFAAAFLGAVSASLVSLVLQPTDPVVGPRVAVSAPAVPAKPPAPAPAPVRIPAPSMDMDDGPMDDCEVDELCDTIDDNDPIAI